MYTKADAFNIADSEQKGTYNFPYYEYDFLHGYGITPAHYWDLWLKMYISPFSEWSELIPQGFDNKPSLYEVSVWDRGGTQIQMYPPPDDEFYDNPNALAMYDFSAFVYVYDSADNLITSGRHVQFPSLGYEGTWIYFKMTKPVVWPYFSLASYSRFRIKRLSRGPIVQEYMMVQDENPKGVVYVMPTGWTTYQNPINALYPNPGHSMGGNAGDILFSGVTCIIDSQGGGVAVRRKDTFAAIYITGTGPNVHEITRNGDGYRNFWVSYTIGGENKVAPITITHFSDMQLESATLEPAMGITDLVTKMCARANQILYYTTQGSNVIKKWDIFNNITLPDLVQDPGLGGVTDIMVLANGDVLVGYNTGTVPTIYTIRRYDGISGAKIRDYTFTSNGAFNRMNYGENNDVFYVWTHEIVGESQLRKVRLSDGFVIFTSKYREFENGKLILDREMYNDFSYPYHLGEPAQLAGFTNKYNFWIAPVSSQLPSAPIITPPDDEFYPPVFTFPSAPIYPVQPDGSPVFPTYPPPVPPPDPPPYPGYPWFPPPPGQIVYPPAVYPLSLKIGGGLIVLDPTNTTRHDLYLDPRGEKLKVPIEVVIRTAFFGD